jgi:hypothetical protein
MSLNKWGPICVVVMLVVCGISSPESSAVQRVDRSQTDGGRPLVRSAHVVLGDCSAKDVTMRVAVSRLAYLPPQPVDVIAVVRNEGQRTCTFGGAGQRNQYIGPCGAFSLQVFNRQGMDIWPGPVAYSCPMIGLTHLAPGADVVATGSWPKSTVTRDSNGPAPAGRYRLVVDRAISLPISLG